MLTMRKPPAQVAQPAPLKSEEVSELDAAMLSVWRQALVERARRVQLGEESYSVRRTAKRGLAQVDFEVAGQPIRGLEQKPKSVLERLTLLELAVHRFNKNGTLSRSRHRFDTIF
jgi:hypothetical protein